jgi:uncharacterized protein YbcV (DUF1398 family)
MWRSMNPSIKEVIEKCAHQSHAGELTSPEVLERLLGVGVESYLADYRDQSSAYYLSNNEALRISMEMPQVDIAESFNEGGVILAIRGAQSDQLRYPEFLRLTMAAGCIGYMVWIAGRHVTYFGRRGEVHIEHFPPG